MRRVKQRKLKQEMPGELKNEVRRARRGREFSDKAGNGHGDRLVEHVLAVNTKPTRAERKEKQETPRHRSLVERILG